MNDKEYKLRKLIDIIRDKYYLQILPGYSFTPRCDKLDNKSDLFDETLDDILAVMNKE